jgi:hypothetical protein
MVPESDLLTGADCVVAGDAAAGEEGDDFDVAAEVGSASADLAGDLPGLVGDPYHSFTP